MKARQITFRAEPQIAEEWSRFVKDSLILQRCHLTCAVLMYMWSGAERRAAAQRAYARFLRQGHLTRPMELDEGPTALSANELQLVAAHRAAPVEAREEALAVLLRGARPALGEADEAELDRAEAEKGRRA